MRTIERVSGRVFPKIDAVPQPVPVVRAGLPLADRLRSEKEPPGKSLGAAVVADDEASERFHDVSVGSREVDRMTDRIPGEGTDARN